MTTVPAVISMASLAFVGVMCIIATLAHSVKDNLVERIGFFVLCVGCIARIYALWREGDVPVNGTLIHLGVAIVFAGSTWAKVRNACRCKGAS